MEFESPEGKTKGRSSPPNLNFTIEFPSQESGLEQMSSRIYEMDTEGEFVFNPIEASLSEPIDFPEEKVFRRNKNKESMNSTGKIFSSARGSYLPLDSLTTKARSEYEQASSVDPRDFVKEFKKRTPSIGSEFQIKVPVVTSLRNRSIVSTKPFNLISKGTSKNKIYPLIKKIAENKEKMMSTEIERLRSSENQLKQRLLRLEDLVDNLIIEKKEIAETYSSMMQEYSEVNEIDRRIAQLEQEKHSRELSMQRLGDRANSLLNSHSQTLQEIRPMIKESLLSSVPVAFTKETPRFDTAPSNENERALN